MRKIIFAATAITAAAAITATAQAADRNKEARWASSVHACLQKAGVDTNQEGSALLIVRKARGLRLVAAPSATQAQKSTGRKCVQRANALASIPGKRVRVRTR